MKIGIVVNVMDTHDAGQTTYRLAAGCVNRGHEVWIMSTGNFCYEPRDAVGALARSAPPRKYPSSVAFVNALNGQGAKEAWITVDALDVLLLRSNPSVQHPWAQYAGIHFGRIAMRHGVIVLNDPNGLSKATDKLYLQTFPEAVRPRTLISRSEPRIREFAAQEGTVVLKPLQGSGGRGVFVVPPSEHANLGEIVRAIGRDGYVVAQEYLPEAAEGDVRLFLVNGVPLQYKGKHAAFRRIRGADDVRSNVHAGGRLGKAAVDATVLRVAEIVRPRLVEDGMFLVGLDVVGDKLMEINVFSPGGLGSAQRIEKVDFTLPVIEALERKVRYMSYYRRKFSNVEMGSL